MIELFCRLELVRWFEGFDGYSVSLWLNWNSGLVVLNGMLGCDVLMVVIECGRLKGSVFCVGEVLFRMLSSVGVDVF